VENVGAHSVALRSSAQWTSASPRRDQTACKLRSSGTACRRTPVSPPMRWLAPCKPLSQMMQLASLALAILTCCSAFRASQAGLAQGRCFPIPCCPIIDPWGQQAFKTRTANPGLGSQAPQQGRRWFDLATSVLLACDFSDDAFAPSMGGADGAHCSDHTGLHRARVSLVSASTGSWSVWQAWIATKLQVPLRQLRLLAAAHVTNRTTRWACASFWLLLYVPKQEPSRRRCPVA